MFRSSFLCTPRQKKDVLSRNHVLYKSLTLRNNLGESEVAFCNGARIMSWCVVDNMDGDGAFKQGMSVRFEVTRQRGLLMREQD